MKFVQICLDSAALWFAYWLCGPYFSLLEQPSVCFWKAGNYSGMRQLKMKFVQICLDSLWICDIDF